MKLIKNAESKTQFGNTVYYTCDDSCTSCSDSMIHPCLKASDIFSVFDFFLNHGFAFDNGYLEEDHDCGNAFPPEQYDSYQMMIKQLKERGGLFLWDKISASLYKQECKIHISIYKRDKDSSVTVLWWPSNCPYFIELPDDL